MSFQLLFDIVVNSPALAIAAASAVFLTVSLVKRYQFMKRCEKIPGPAAQLPLFGSFTEFFLKPEEILPHFVHLYQRWNQNGLYRVWIGPRPLFIFGSAESAEVILSSNKHLDKSFDYDYIKPWLATGLVTSTGTKWQQRRKLLTPTFHFKILEDFINIFNEQSDILVDKLNATIGKESDILPFITLCTLDIICETAMGRHLNAQTKSDSLYVEAVYKMGRIIEERGTLPWLQSDLLFNLFPQAAEQKRCLSILHSFTDQIIRERKIEHKLRKGSQTRQVIDQSTDDDNFLSRKRRLAFLDLLIEASEDGKVLSDLDIREEVDTFLVAGHDTTAAATSWSLFLIGNHPEVQEKVSEELLSVLGESDRPITMTDLSELKYLECCIKESLRLFPSVPLIGRQLKEDTIINQRSIPAGAAVTVAPFIIHRDPNYFPDPESFQPERFFPENVHGRHPYAYIPFSAGPRNCIGQRFALMEEKVILASILRRFNVESLDKVEGFPLISDLILRPRDKIRLRLTAKKSLTNH